VNRADRRATVKAAARPPARTVEVSIDEGAFAGWAATARADFPARLLVDLESGSMAKVLVVLEAIVTDHNFPNETGELAATLGDVEPYDGLLAVSAKLLEAIGRLPNR
jgi:hypothetical protein